MENFQEISRATEKIEIQKELLSTLPRNNKKNEQQYIEKIEEIKKEYENYRNEIKKYLEEQYNLYINIKEDNQIELLKGRINTIEKILYLLSNEKNSLEKMNLDRILFNLSRYYRKNLDEVNKEISECIKMFNEVEVSLTEEDFNYSKYTKEYMQIFLAEQDYKTSEKLKNKFEEIYWKCPEIIIQIGLNIRNIYLNKKSAIDKYFEKAKNDLLKKWDKSRDDIIKSYLDLKNNLEEKENKDKKLLLDKFLNGELNSQDYRAERINDIYSQLIEDNDSDKEQIQKNVNNFLKNIYEYKNYLKFKFIIDDIKNIYSQKENNKKKFAETRKEIEKTEKKLKRINKSSFLRKENNRNIKQEKLISQLEELYKQLDKERFNKKIYENINENSSLYEILVYAKSNYSYMANRFIENNPEIESQEIEGKINELKIFMRTPYHTILKNIHISDDKNIQVIIKDRYRLLNFKVETEDLDEDKLDILEKNLNTIKLSLDMESAKLKIEDLDIVCKIKELLKI